MDVAKTYLDLIIEINGKLGADFVSNMYKVHIDYRSNKMYTDASNKNILKFITYIYIESVEPYEEQN